MTPCRRSPAVATGHPSANRSTRRAEPIACAWNPRTRARNRGVQPMMRLPRRVSGLAATFFPTRRAGKPHSADPQT